MHPRISETEGENARFFSTRAEEHLDTFSRTNRYILFFVSTSMEDRRGDHVRGYWLIKIEWDGDEILCRGRGTKSETACSRIYTRSKKEDSFLRRIDKRLVQGRGLKVYRSRSSDNGERRNRERNPFYINPCAIYIERFLLFTLRI